MRIEKYLHQTLVYWRRTGGTATSPMHAQPVEIKCRWEDANTEVIEPRGRTVISNSHIYTAVDMVEGSWVFLGTLAQWRQLPGYPKLPDFNQGGRELTRSMRTPDIKARHILYEWYL